jgi:hypothetical protein
MKTQDQKDKPRRFYKNNFKFYQFKHNSLWKVKQTLLI